MEYKYEDYIGVIISFATKYQTSKISREDLISEGNVVFCECLKNFDSKKNTKFITLLYSSLKNHFVNLTIRNGLRKNGRHISFTEDIYNRKKNIQESSDDFLDEISHDLSEGANEVVSFIVNTTDIILKELNVGVASAKGLRVTKKGLQNYFCEVRNWRHKDWILFSKEIKNYLAGRI